MSGQWGVKVEPSFHISTPHVSRDERPSLSQPRNEAPFIDPCPREGVPQSAETKPLRPDVSTQLQLPKTEIVMFDGNPLHYHLFIKTIENSEEKFTGDGDIRLQLLIQYCTGKAREAIKSWECLMVCRATKRQRSSERNMLCLRRRLTSFPWDLQLD